MYSTMTKMVKFHTMISMKQSALRFIQEKIYTLDKTKNSWPNKTHALNFNVGYKLWVMVTTATFITNFTKTKLKISSSNYTTKVGGINGRSSQNKSRQTLILKISLS